MLINVKTSFLILIISIFCSKDAYRNAPVGISESSVDIITGSYLETNTDIAIPGPLPFTLKREFNSDESSQSYPLAEGWRWKILHPALQMPKGTNRLHLCLFTNSANQLKSVKVNRTATLSWIRFEQNGDWLELTSHDGQKWRLLIENDTLKKVIAPEGEEISYQYSGGQISSRETANGHCLINEFYELGSNELEGQTIEITDPEDSRIGKVRLQKTVTDIDMPPIVIARYLYYPGKTEVINALGMKKIYHFSQDLGRVLEIEVYDKQIPVRKERFDWKRAKSGKPLLVFHAAISPEGTILKSRKYEYDENERLVKETLSGRLTGNPNSIESYSHIKTYSEDGLLISKVEDNGSYTSYRYDPETFLLNESETGQGQTRYFRTECEYDSNGILIKTVQTDLSSERSEQKITRITPSEKPHSAGLPELIEESLWDENGEKSKRTTLNSYAARGQIAEQEFFDSDSQAKKIIRKEFDEAGREIYQSDTSKGDILTVYRPGENVVVQTDMETGEITESRYNFQKRIVWRKVTKPGGNTLTQSNQYDALGHLTLSRDVLGNETVFVYDSLGRLIEKTDPPVLDENDKPIRYRSSYCYNALNQMISFTDQNNETTHFHYTARDEPYLIEYPDGSTDEFIYNSDGTLRRHKTREGKTTIYERDGLGRVTETRSLTEKGAFLECQSASYQGWSSIETTDSAGNSRKYSFNEEEKFDLKKTEKKAVRMSWDPGEHLNYDFKNDRGQRTLQKIIVQPNGSQTVSTLDALGRVEKVEVKDPFGTMIAKKECRYDGVGNITLQRDMASSNTFMEIRWAYWPGGHVKQKTENGSTFSYEYNRLGKLTKVVKPDGVSLSYVYHPSGDLERIVSSDGTIDAEYVYDNQRRVVQAVDHVACSSTLREYDSEGRMIREVLGNNLEIINAYNEKGKRVKMTLPDASGVAYDYDGKKLTAVHRLDADGHTSYSHKYKAYNSKGYLKEAKFIKKCGKLAIKRTQENRLEKLSTPYVNQQMTYDNGKLVHVATNHSSFEKKHKAAYAYNDLGQLIQDGGKALDYDSAGNLLTKGSQTFELNESHQVVKAKDACYGYDQNGNLVFKDENGSHTAYYYDALDRLIEVQTEDKTITYAYDPFHRRLSRQIMGEDPMHFIFDGDNEIGLANAAFDIQELRILGLGLGAEIGAAVAIEIEKHVFLPIHDHRGSVVSLVDTSNKKVREIYQYDAYGKETIMTRQGKKLHPEDAINPWRFSGKRIDVDTGLIHFGKREYAPSLCRWISQDPLGFFDGVNRYAFARCNPMQNIDLYGLFSLKGVWETISSAAKHIKNYAADCFNACFESFHPLETLYRYLHEIGNFLVGERYLILSGLITSESHTGIYGGGFEPHEKYRITFINGILTAAKDLENNLALISQSHGGCNVHYCHVGTKGWTCDLIRSVFSKFGDVSKEAKALAQIWRDLIEDMGGVDSGGIIFHYAHSLGGTETLHAKYLLSPEEQRMIRVITMGSPTLIPDDGFHSVINIISCRDIISIFDPINFIYSLIFGASHVFFVGSHWDGWPIIDHTFFGYWEHWKENFWQEYEDILNELFQ